MPESSLFDSLPSKVSSFDSVVDAMLKYFQLIIFRVAICFYSAGTTAFQNIYRRCVQMQLLFEFNSLNFTRHEDARRLINEASTMIIIRQGDVCQTFFQALVYR